MDSQMETDQTSRGRSRRVPSVGACVPTEGGESAPGVDVVTSPAALELRTFGISWRLPHAGASVTSVMSVINSLSRPSAGSGGQGWGRNFQASNHGLGFAVTSPHPGRESPH